MTLRKFAAVNAALLCGVCFVSGCGQTSSTNTAPATQSAANPSTAPIASAASDFMDAQAMQRIIASGKQFSPPGMATATFKIGEVRTPAVDRAFVHCILTDAAPGAPQRSEEMCCLMRKVENDWRVSGIAYWSGPNQAGTMSDFETGQSMPIPRDPAISGSGMPGSQPAVTSPGMPPRMANEPATTAPR
jgi:hypothetical protein